MDQNNPNLNTIPSVQGADSIREDRAEDLTTTQPVPSIQGLSSLGQVASPDLDSDEEQDPAVAQLHKQELLNWVTQADFTGELSLTQLANHKFRLDPEEAS